MMLYLGGKMLGQPGFDFPAFHHAAYLLRDLGHAVFNPAERDQAAGFDPTGSDGSYGELVRQKFDRRAALRADVDWIAAHSEGMVALETWVDSPGTKAEIALHQALYLPVWELGDFLRLGPRAPVLCPLLPGGHVVITEDAERLAANA